MPQTNPVQSAERIFEILEALVQSGPVTLTELSTRLSLHKSTVHRLLKSLILMGYARQEEESGKYLPTYKVLGLAGMLLSKLDILAVARPHLERLMRQTHETVHFVQRENTHIIYVDKVESDANSIRMVSRIGLRQPMYSTGVGKAILAQMKDSEIREVWKQSEIQPFTPHTIITPEQLMQEIELVRRQGYALDNEENELGVRCIAASVTDFYGRATNAFSISAPVSRMSDERVRELSEYVLQTKRALSQELGFSGK